MLRPFLSFLLLHSFTAAQNCPLCFDGSDPNLDKTIGGSPDGPKCSSLVSDVDIDLDGCRDLQILGYRWCDCPTYQEELFCSMCQDAFVDLPNPWKEIPGTSKTCDEKLFVKASDLESCDEAMKPGFVCGCPDAEEPHCTICGMSVADDAKITQPNALITIDKVGSFSCQELVNQAVLDALTVEQCALVQSEAFETCGCVGSSPSTDDLGRQETNATTPPEVPTETDSNDEKSAATMKGLAWVGVLAPLLLHL